MRAEMVVAGLAVTLGTAAHALDLDALKAQGAIRVIVAADEAPETFTVQPAADAGFERELLEGFTRLNALRLEVVAARGYGDRIPMLLKGDGDLIVAIFDTPDRRRQVAFTVEVMPTHNVAVTLSPRAVVASLSELRGLKVGVINGAKPAETAVEAGVPPTALVGFNRREELLDALRSGAVGAGILPVSELALAAKRLSGLQAGTTIGEAGKVAWAVRKEDSALRRALDEYIANVRRSPTWSRLIVKYFGDQALTVLGRGR
jgi:membrane-bound lytic murein transglycosylase F